jgi:hypothetical protein
MESLYALNYCLQKKKLPPEIRKVIIAYAYSPKELASYIIQKRKNIDLFLLYKQELCKQILVNSGYKFHGNEWKGQYYLLLSTITDIIDTFKKNRNYIIELNNIRDTLEYIRSHSLLEETEIPFDIRNFVARNALVYDKNQENMFKEKLENIISILKNGNPKNVNFGLSMMSILGKNYVHPHVKIDFINNVIRYTTPDSSDDYKIHLRLLDAFIIYDGYCIDVRYVIKEAIHQSNEYVLTNYVRINSRLVTYGLSECIKQNNFEIFKILLMKEIINSFQSCIDVDYLIDQCNLQNSNSEFIHRLSRFKRLREKRCKKI